MAQVGPVLFSIQKSKKSLPKLVYVDKLKPFYGDPPGYWDEDIISAEKPEPDEGIGLEAVIPPQLVRPQRVVNHPVRYRIQICNEWSDLLETEENLIYVRFYYNGNCIFLNVSVVLYLP